MGRAGSIVKGLYDAFARGNIAAVLGALDPGAEWREADSSRYADGNPYIGPEAVAEGVFQRLARDFEDFTATPTHIIDGGIIVVVEGRYAGTVRATGAALDAQFAHVWQLREGKVARFQQYTDTRRWAEAAGAQPEGGGDAPRPGAEPLRPRIG